MQSKRYTNKKTKTLKQGSIFTFKNTKFPLEKNGQQVEKLLSEFYPEIDFNNAEYCIVLSQSCDVYYDGKRLPKDILVVNLNKLFSVKIEHYPLILEKVKYELKSEYSDKLGWKLAELFGRVGTDDYSESNKKKLGNLLYEEIYKKKMPKNAIYINPEQFQKLKSSHNNSEKLKVAVEHILLENGIK